MSSRRVRPTHEQHLELARKLGDLYLAAKEFEGELRQYYPKSSKVMSSFSKMSVYGKGFGQFKSILDDEYHSVTSEDQFMKEGHVYYNLDRFNDE